MNGPSLRRDPDLSPSVLEDLFRYPRKNPTVAWLLWLTTGVLGGHRFYMERPGTGILMLFTSGGLFVWWIIDAFRLGGMIRAYNAEQERRERAGLPPIQLSFMPALEPHELQGTPAWAHRRRGLHRLLGDAVVLLVAGVALGSITRSTGNIEGVVAILVLIVVTNLGARWSQFSDRPILRALDRWNHRLRLYYFINDPGSSLSRLVRPIVGPISAFLRRKAMFEAKLNVQLGGVFVLAFVLIDLVQALIEGGGPMGILRELMGDMAMTFVIIYAFAAPIGATLTLQILLTRTDRVVWVLSGVTVFAMVVGLVSG